MKKILLSLLLVVPLPSLIAQTNVTLTWNTLVPLAAEERYFVRWGMESNNYVNVTWSTNATNVTIVALLPEVTYYFVVIGLDTNLLETPPSNELVYRATNPFPGETLAELKIAWDPVPASPDLAGYLISIGRKLGDYTELARVGPTVTSYLVTDLLPGVNYYFVIASFGLNGVESRNGNVLSYIPPVIIPATQPIPTGLRKTL